MNITQEQVLVLENVLTETDRRRVQYEKARNTNADRERQVADALRAALPDLDRQKELEDNCDNLNAEWQAAVERENRLLHRIAETRNDVLDEVMKMARETWLCTGEEIATAIEKLKEVMPNKPD